MKEMVQVILNRIDYTFALRKHFNQRFENFQRLGKLWKIFLAHAPSFKPYWIEFSISKAQSQLVFLFLFLKHQNCCSSVWKKGEKVWRRRKEKLFMSIFRVSEKIKFFSQHNQQCRIALILDKFEKWAMMWQMRWKNTLELTPSNDKIVKFKFNYSQSVEPMKKKTRGRKFKHFYGVVFYSKRNILTSLCAQ